MTDVEMDAGPECDVAVAEACGTSHLLFDETGATTFQPSTDCNDALFAADKFGLFKNRMLGRVGPYWQVVNVADEPAEGSCFLTSVADALTGPLAICRAILTLHAGT